MRQVTQREIFRSRDAGHSFPRFVERIPEPSPQHPAFVPLSCLQDWDTDSAPPDLLCTKRGNKQAFCILHLRIARLEQFLGSGFCLRSHRLARSQRSHIVMTEAEVVIRNESGYIRHTATKDFGPLEFTGKVAGGLRLDLRRRLPHYCSDWTDAFKDRISRQSGVEFENAWGVMQAQAGCSRIGLRF